jgi:hypothetical protein
MHVISTSCASRTKMRPTTKVSSAIARLLSVQWISETRVPIASLVCLAARSPDDAFNVERRLQ